MIKKAVFFLGLYSIIGYAQDTDTQFRLNPSIDYKINKKWKVAFDYRYALEKDISTFQASNFQLALTYKIAKSLSLETGYRFSTSFERDNHRFFAGLTYDYKLKRFTLSSRTRYQFTTQSFDADFMSEYKAPVQFLRQKFTVNYNLPKSKFSVYTAAEFFLKLEQPQTALNRMRYQLGSDYQMKFGNTIGLSLLYEDRINATKTDRFILTAKYNLSLDEMLKKVRKQKKKKLAQEPL